MLNDSPVGEEPPSRGTYPGEDIQSLQEAASVPRRSKAAGLSAMRKNTSA
jgi:hypothetical protein